MPKFKKTYCSQCGAEFGPGDHGFSHCEDHGGAPAVTMEETIRRIRDGAKETGMETPEERITRSLRAPEWWWDWMDAWAAEHAQSTNASILLLAQFGRALLEEYASRGKWTPEKAAAIKEVLDRR